MAEPGRLTLAEEDRRILAGWAADCAEHVLPLFEAVAPGDSRPRAAIEGLRAFGRGELKVGPARALSVAAHAAARELATRELATRELATLESDAAAHATKAGSVIAAAVAAARAAGQAVATAHMGAHARGAPAYAALAARLASGGDDAAAEREVSWALDHASADVRAVLRKLPEPPRSAGLLGVVIARLHEEVAADTS